MRVRMAIPFDSMLPRQALAGEVVEIVLPIGGAVAAQLVQIVPAIDAGRVHVVEHEPHRVIANRMHFEDGDVALAGDGLALVRRMALHLRARAPDAQILGIELEALAAVEGDDECLAVLAQPQLGRPGLRCGGVCHGLDQFPVGRWPSAAPAARSSPGSMWKSMTQTPPALSTDTPFEIAAFTSAALVTGPMPTAPCASASLAMLGNGSSMRNPIQRFLTSRERVRATVSWCSSSLKYDRLL